MSTTASSTKPRPPIRPLFQFQLGKLMALVAVCAVLISAWLFRRDNATVERSLTGRSIRALAEGDKAQRLEAIEELARAEPDDASPLVAALAGALGDDEWPLRSAAAQALGSAIRRGVEGGNGTLTEEIKLATGALIHAFGDPIAVAGPPRSRLEPLALRARGRYLPGGPHGNAQHQSDHFFIGTHDGFALQAIRCG